LSQDFFGSLDEPGRPPSICAGMRDLPQFARAYGLIDDPDVGLVEKSSWDTIDDGLAWARVRAHKVYARVGHSNYRSAGGSPSRTFQAWPPDESAICSERIRPGRG